MSEFAIPKSVVPKQIRRERKKLKDINCAITCSICKGYIVDATTINVCFHSFCRSCIVKHLEKSTFCPTCSPSNNRPIQRSNLRPDKKLKTLIYKMVPGLWQSENRRQQKFNEENNIYVDGQTMPLTLQSNTHNHPREFEVNAGRNGYGLKRVNNNCNVSASSSSNTGHNSSAATAAASAAADDDDEHFYSVDDPISLSLEYHPIPVAGCDKSALPPIKYLQCPAAVTVRHLQRFLSSKYILSLESGTTQIDIIYEDELLPADFTLMDVAYTYNWKRVDPMRLFYQIFVTSPSVGHETVPSTKEVKTSSSNSNNNNSNTNNNKNSALFNVNNNNNGNNNHSKKYQNNQQQQQQQQQQQYTNNNGNNIQATSHASLTGGSKAKQPNEAKTANFSSIATSSSSGLIDQVHDAKNARFASVKPKAAAKAAAHKSKHGGDNAKGNDTAVDADSCYSFSDEKPLKVAFVSSKNAKGSKTYNILPASSSNGSSSSSNGNGNVSPAVASSKPDFKSLRSNVSHNAGPSAASSDNTYHNDSSKLKLNNSGTVTEYDSKPHSVKATKTESNACTSKSAMKHGGGDAKQKHKTTSGDGKNSRSAILNSPNIVVSIPQHRRVSFSDEVFENISLAELKTANKKSKSDGSPKYDRPDDEEKKELPKLKIALSHLKGKIMSPKHREKSRKEPESSQSNDTVLDYVGLKPVSQSSENSRSPKSDDCPEYGHKKRKKSGKHSKEPGSKRRKMHAEISSQEEESLKLKVKITTGKHSKHERKSSVTSSDENSSGSSSTINSEPKEIESPVYEAVCPSPRRIASETPSRKQPPTPPNASPARVQEDDVVFVSSTKGVPTKPMKFTAWKEPKANAPRVSVVPAPSSTTKPTFAVPVGKPKVAKPQSMADLRARCVFSPPHVPNYATFHIPPMVSTSPQLSPLKRSSSVDTRPEMPKMPKLDVPARKNSVPNLIKATLPMKSNAVASQSPNANNEVYYNSALSSTYTREVQTKKPVPMLLPQASVTVSEVSGNDSPSYTAASLDGRPALEIVRIPANVPTVDQQHKQKLQQQAASQAQKANRPMPSTIPLQRIRNASNQIKLNAREAEGSAALDLSGGISRSPSHSPSPPTIANRQLNTYSSASLPRLVTVSAPSSSQSMTIKSAPMSIAVSNSMTRTINSSMSRVLPKSAIPPSIASSNSNKNVNVRTANGLPATAAAVNNQRDKLLPPLYSTMNAARQMAMPKLNEIVKSRPNGPVRQQNASVRNIPNPSILAFRNQGVQPKNPRERSSPPTAVSVASSTASTGFTTASPKAQSPTLPTGNRTPTFTSGSVDISVKNRGDAAVTITPMLRSVDTALLLPISKQLKAPTLSKQHALNSDIGCAVGRNNNNDIIDAKLIAAKKNQHIERLAATLRAAAANDAAAPQRLSMSPVSKSTGTSISS